MNNSLWRKWRFQVDYLMQIMKKQILVTSLYEYGCFACC